MKKLIIVLSLILAAHTFSFAQTETSKKEAKTKTIYTCSMHAEIVSDKEGKCPKCGMKLVKAKQKNGSTEKVYVCTMCKEVTSKKPVKCPKCGMKLTEKVK